jgi:hypothetical protein
MDRPNAEMPALIGQTGPLNGQRWTIGQTLIIGRDPTCNVMIPDRQISRFHARLTPSNKGVLLEDLGSKNGTYLKGKKVIDPVFLQDGDAMQVALVQHFVFLSSDSTMPMEKDFVEPKLRGKIYVDAKSRRVWVGSKEMIPPLSVPQFRLLQILCEQQGKVVSRQELISEIWPDQEPMGISDQALDALVRRLRDRIAQLDPKYNYVVTARGYGLRLDNPTE